MTAISQLTDGGALQPTDVIPVQRGSGPVRVTLGGGAVAGLQMDSPEVISTTSQSLVRLRDSGTSAGNSAPAIGSRGQSVVIDIDESELVRVTTAGVGIGSAAPQAKLDLRGNSWQFNTGTPASITTGADLVSNYAARLRAGPYSSGHRFDLFTGYFGAGSYGYQILTDANAPGGTLVLQPLGGEVSAGRLLVNKTTGTEDLEVHGSIAATDPTPSFSVGAPRAQLDYVPASNLARVGAIDGTGTADALAFITNKSERARFQGANFGIGTSGPQGRLHVTTQPVSGGASYNSAYADFIVERDTGVGMTLMTANDQRSRIGFGSPSDSVGAIVDWGHDSNSMRVGSSKAGAHLSLHSGNFDEAVRVDPDGDLLVGTTSTPIANGRNIVASSALNAARLHLIQTGTGRHFYVGSTAAGRFAIYDQTADAERISLTDAGFLGLGTTSPAEIIHAEGSGGVRARVRDLSMSDGDTAGFNAFGTSGSDTRRSDLGVFKHAGITRPASFLRLEAEDGTPYFLWVDNAGTLRVSTSANNVGTTAGSSVGSQT